MHPIQKFEIILRSKFYYPFLDYCNRFTQSRKWYTYSMQVLISWVVSALVILAISYLLPGIHVANFLTALVVALVLGILNAIIKPILFVLTLPITILTLGLFTFILNAVIVLLTSYLVPGFAVDGFLWAFIFSIVLSLANSILHSIYQ